MKPKIFGVCEGSCQDVHLAIENEIIWKMRKNILDVKRSIKVENETNVKI